MLIFFVVTTEKMNINKMVAYVYYCGIQINYALFSFLNLTKSVRRFYEKVHNKTRKSILTKT